MLCIERSFLLRWPSGSGKSPLRRSLVVAARSPGCKVDPANGFLLQAFQRSPLGDALWDHVLMTVMASLTIQVQA